MRDKISFLNQLIKSLEDASEKLEESYKKKDQDKFNKIKKFMLRIQEQISERVNHL